MKSKILLTGGTGYVGKHLIEFLLQKDFEIISFYREMPLSIASHNLVQVRLSEQVSVKEFEEILHEYNPTLVIHLATLYLAEHTSTDVKRLVDSNVLFGSMLLEAMKNQGIKRFLNVGTLWQHYENDVYQPVNLYAATKEALEQIIGYYVKLEGFASLTVELMDTYGGNDTRGKLIQVLTKAKTEKKVFEFAEGKQWICLTHIEDVLRGFLRAIELIEQSALGVAVRVRMSSEESLQLKDVVALFEKVHGVTMDCRWGVRPYRKREIFTPITYGVPLDGWKATISLEEGLRMELERLNKN